MDQHAIMSASTFRSRRPSICVIDDAGAIIWRGKCRSDPDTITAIVRQHAPGAVQVGLETGQLSNWLTLTLRRRGVPFVCMDARHAKAALSLQINKTDANDDIRPGTRVSHRVVPGGRGEKHGCSYLVGANDCTNPSRKPERGCTACSRGT